MKKVLLKPIISEKATSLSENENVYSFRVENYAQKINVKHEVSKVYGVEVEDVRMMLYYRKTKSKHTKKGLITGKTKSYKKALVKVKKGQFIDLYNL